MHLSFHSFFKSITILILFLQFSMLQAQDSINTDKFRRNAIKIGTSPTVSKYFLSYEYAFLSRVSVGGMASYNLGNFSGYTANIFARVYFIKKFNRSGPFIEIRGSYAHFNPYVYTGYHRGIFGGDQHLYYEGEHHADIDYWSAGISAGYKIFCTDRIFFDFILGYHSGNVTFGPNDIYFAKQPASPYGWGSSEVQTVFYESGPGVPWHSMASFGILF